MPEGYKPSIRSWSARLRIADQDSVRLLNAP
jgi:hypothetical protein